MTAGDVFAMILIIAGTGIGISLELGQMNKVLREICDKVGSSDSARK